MENTVSIDKQMPKVSYVSNQWMIIPITIHVKKNRHVFHIYLIINAFENIT